MLTFNEDEGIIQTKERWKRKMLANSNKKKYTKLEYGQP